MFEAALTDMEQLYIIEILRWLHISGIRVARNLVGILVEVCWWFFFSLFSILYNRENDEIYLNLCSVLYMFKVLK